MKNDSISAVIIDDSDEEQVIVALTKAKRIIKKQEPLKKFHIDDKDIFEIGVDEAGRGPMFGRVYTAAVILPKDDSFDHSKMKDSKKFHSKKKIEEVAEYIKANALGWYVSYEDEKTIDEINILQATQKSMHTSILEVRKQYIQKMKEEGIEVLLDDRDTGVGSKLADSDLFGIPYRVIVSEKSLAAGGYEVKKRKESDPHIINEEALISILKNK
jgi:ribonuclease HII